MDTPYYILWSIFLVLCCVGLFWLAAIAVNLKALVDILDELLDKLK